MDVNGARYQLLFGASDWQGCRLQDGTPPHWDDARGEVTLAPLLFRFPAGAGDRPLRSSDRRGAASDRFGNVYYLAADARSVLVHARGAREARQFFDPEARPSEGSFRPVTAPPPAPHLLSGAVVTACHHLVVGKAGTEPGLLIFDLYAEAPPRTLEFPAEIAFTPFDLAPSPDGGFVVLDREHRRYWTVTGHFQVSGEGQTLLPIAPADQAFRPLAAPPPPAPPSSFPAGVDVGASEPLAIACAEDGTVLVLDRVEPDATLFDAAGDPRVSSRILAFRNGARREVVYRYEVSTGADLGIVRELLEGPAATFQLAAHDIAVVGGLLYVESAAGNQTFAFRLSDDDLGRLVLEPLPVYFPMRRCDGRALVESRGRVFYDSAGIWVPLIEQRRPRYAEHARIETPRLDGKAAGCLWHRLMIDAIVPEGTSLSVWSRAHDDPAALASLPWTAEPSPLHARDTGREDALAAGESAPHTTLELLLQRATGRHLQIAIELSGNRVATPRLRALRAWYPRTSWVERYLPPVYSAADADQRFLERYVANLEGMLTEIEGRIARADKLFGPDTAPREALDWLASWMALAFDPAASEQKRRFMIRHAVELYAWRGTPRGVLRAAALALTDAPGEWILSDARLARCGIRLVEGFRTRSARPRSRAASRIFWTPERGAAALMEAWAAVSLTPASFPLRPPELAPARWRAFALRVLGFVPAARCEHDQAFRAFLRRRYRTTAALRAAYGSSTLDFKEVALPDNLPPDGSQLGDWYDFETGVLEMRRTAHRFTLLLPLGPLESAAESGPQARKAAVRSAVEIQKPAHTRFDVGFYSEAFRLGGSRLGLDSIVHADARALSLAPAVLGRTHVAATVLRAGFPQDARGRISWAPDVTLPFRPLSGDRP